jgi:hypothetical protein
MSVLTTEPPLMNDNQHAGCDRDTRLENYAAELTSAVYPLVLRRGLKDSWLKVELGLWRALVETVKTWARQRPPAVDSDEFETWREEFLVDLTENAFCIALNNGIQGSPLELELGLYRTFCLMIRRRIYVRESV